MKSLLAIVASTTEVDEVIDRAANLAAQWNMHLDILGMSVSPIVGGYGFGAMGQIIDNRARMANLVMTAAQSPALERALFDAQAPALLAPNAHDFGPIWPKSVVIG